MTLDEAARRYAAQLQALGYATETDCEDAQCDLSFVRGDETFYLEVYEDDLRLARFSLAYSLDDAVKADRARLLDLAHENSAACEGAVTLIDEENDVEFRHDAFVGEDLDLRPTLERILDALEDAQERFFESL